MELINQSCRIKASVGVDHNSAILRSRKAACGQHWNGNLNDLKGRYRRLCKKSVPDEHNN